MHHMETFHALSDCHGNASCLLWVTIWGSHPQIGISGTGKFLAEGWTVKTH